MTVVHHQNKFAKFFLGRHKDSIIIPLTNNSLSIVQKIVIAESVQTVQTAFLHHVMISCTVTDMHCTQEGGIESSS